VNTARLIACWVTVADGKNDGSIPPPQDPPTHHREPPMITAIVRFKLPANVTLDAATELFKGSAPKYQNLPGLVRKYFLYVEGTGGGVYLWKSRADAEKVYTAEWRAMIAQRYGPEPEITFFESPVIVDNDAQSVQVAAE